MVGYCDFTNYSLLKPVLGQMSRADYMAVDDPSRDTLVAYLSYSRGNGNTYPTPLVIG